MTVTHNERDGVSNHQRFDCLLTRLSRRRLNKTSKLRVCEGNPPVTGGFPSQRTSDVENISIWWRHHGLRTGHCNLHYWCWYPCWVMRCSNLASDWLAAVLPANQNPCYISLYPRWRRPCRQWNPKNISSNVNNVWHQSCDLSDDESPMVHVVALDRIESTGPAQWYIRKSKPRCKAPRFHSK